MNKRKTEIDFSQLQTAKILKPDNASLANYSNVLSFNLNISLVSVQVKREKNINEDGRFHY